MITRTDLEGAATADSTAGTEQDLHRDTTDEPATGTEPSAGTAEIDRTQEEIVRPAATDRPAVVDEGQGDLPLPGYRQLTVPEIIRQAAELPIDQLRAVKDYEKSHRRRKTLLTKLERMLRAPKEPAGPGGDGPPST